MNFRNLGQRSVENNRQDDADGSLYQIIGDGCSGGKTLAENQRLIAEIPGDHDDLGKGLAAAASIPNNLVQAAVGIVLSVVLYTVLSKLPELHKTFWKGEINHV